MRIQVAPHRPWAPDETRLAMRGRAVVRLKPGEIPKTIPSYGDVRAGALTAASWVDRGPVDRAIRRFSPAVRVTRAFESAQHVGETGRRHQGWDDLEESLGLSRTLRLEVDPDAPVRALVEELLALEIVEAAKPHYLSQAPFGAARALEPHGDGLPLGAAPASRASADRLQGHDMVGGLQALAMEPGDPTIIVAIVDSGVALFHEELAGKLRPGMDLVDLPKAQISRGLQLFGDTEGRDREPMDAMGHGTGCAGIIGAIGKRAAPGLAGEARLLPLRALAGAIMVGRNEPTAVGGLPDIDAAVKLGVDLGAKVLNLSFGTPETALDTDEEPPHAEVVAYALQRGCVTVAASGNSGDTMRYYPACLPGVLAVGSVGPDGAPSRFTTRGDHVVLSAPGEGIYCPALVGYQVNTGTSFAAPFVAAAAALLIARAARYSTPLNAAAIRRVLSRTAAPWPRGCAADGCGAGILDVPAALREIDETLRALDDGSAPSREPEDDRIEAQQPSEQRIGP